MRYQLPANRILVPPCS